MNESSTRDATDASSLRSNGPSSPATAEHSSVDLPDGRTLAYAEYGDPDGVPVLAFHGVLGSRLTWGLCGEVADDLGVRVVAPERPGFGYSTFQRGRTLLDWPPDVRALLDHLGIDRFGVAGFSAGGPHAVACAHAMPERLRGVALVSSVTPPRTHGHGDPFNNAFLSATRLVPGFSRTAFETAAWLAEHSRSQFRASLVGTAAAPDRELFDRPVGDYLVRDAAEAFRQGGEGPAHDLPLVGDDWGFDVATLDLPVALFHGTADATVRSDTARAFGDLLPDCDLHLTDDAHYSTLVHEQDAILRAAAGL